MKKYINLLIILICNLIYSQDLKPLGTYDNLISHTYYSLSYSEEHKQAEWVYYKLNSSQLDPTVKRKNNFRKDPKIIKNSADLNDYKNSGYDRGHLAPAADMKYNSDSMSESFYLSNVSPQSANFNRGIWKKIEEQIRDWSYMYGELIIITGPILQCENFGKIGANRVTIPKWYYKVVIDPDNYKRNLAILIENTASSNSIKNYVITINQLEEFSGINFFYRLPDLIEESFESSKNLNLWFWKK